MIKFFDINKENKSITKNFKKVYKSNTKEVFNTIYKILNEK